MMNFDYSSPYTSTRLPVFARNMVSTSHPLAAQAGLRMMLKGGNAVDAIIATAAALTILEPVSNGLGSDSFCILWDGKELHGLNASGRAPAAWTADYFTRKYGAPIAGNSNAVTSKTPKRGLDSVTVPGAVSSWVALSKRFGKLPFADLLEPAIDIARRGYLLPPIIAQKWQAATPEQRVNPGFSENFLPWGRAPEIGDLFKFEAAARGLESIAKSGGESYYRGEIAAAIAKFMREQGGAMTEADLAAYQPEWVKPISKNYRDHTLHEIPPNGQGICALIALGILNHFDLRSMKVDSPDFQHVQIEAMKLAFADVYQYVGEPANMEVTAAQMLDDAYLAERAKLIRMDKAQDFGAGNPVKGGTVYLTAADENGMMVSFIQSNFMGFGSGCVEPQFGISLQNRGHDFLIGQGSANDVAPGKRPRHTILPAFLTKDGQPVMSFGVMGANMQPQGHVQTVVRMLDHLQNPQAACDAPRWRYNQGFEINVEGVMNAQTVQALKDRGHQTEVIQDNYQDFGAGQFIWRMGDPKIEGYQAASDPRRDGQAVGF